MKRSTPAGDFRNRFSFEKRQEGDDGYGNVRLVFVPQFTRWAKYAPLKGGEGVMAARLASRVPAILTIRRDSATAAIDAGWRCVDTASGTIFDIRTVTRFPERAGELDLLIESGVSAGEAAAIPAAPVIATASPLVTNDATPLIAGTAVPGAIVTVALDGSALASVYADTEGAWNFTFAALADATYAVTARQATGGGVSPASAALALTVDTAAPAAPIITTSSPFVTNDDTPTIEGTAEAGSTVHLYADGTAAGTPVTADSNGDWSFTFAPLADGTISVTATATDAAGNTSGSSGALTLTVDTAIPDAPVITTASPFITVDPTPEIAGTAEANAAVTVYLDGEVYDTTMADGAGAWAYEFDELDVATYAVTATVTDAAGNVSAPSAALSLDVRAPLQITGTPQTESVVEEAYEGSVFAAIGGVPPYAYAATGGALPPGFALDPSTGVLSCIETQAEGEFPGIVIRATDSQGNIADRDAFTIGCVWPWDARKDFYVHSNGDDDNDGLTPETAFKTLARIKTAAAGFGAPVKLGYMAGSMWWEENDLADIPGVTVWPDGDVISLGFPVIRGDEIVEGPFDTNVERGDAFANTLSYEWHFTIDPNQQGVPPHMYRGMDAKFVDLMIWEPDAALRDATPGAFWHDGDTTATSPVTIYFTPHTEGEIYTATKRNWVFRIGAGAASFLRTMNQGHDNGSTNADDDGRLNGIVATGGNVHDILAGGGVMKDCYAERLRADPRSGYIGLEFFRPNGAGKRGKWKGCAVRGQAGATSMKGFGGHVSNPTDANRFDAIEIENCRIINCDATFRDARNILVDRLFNDDGQLTMIANVAGGTTLWKDVRVRATGARGAAPLAGTVPLSRVDIEGLRAHVTGAFPNGILGGMNNWRGSRSVIVSETDSPTTVARDASGNTVLFGGFTESVIEIRGYATTNNFYECIGTSVKPEGGSNVWSGFGRFRIRDAGVNITYDNLAALQAGQSLEVGSFAVDTEAQFGPEQAGTPFLLGTGWTNNGDGTYTQSGAGNGAADRIEWTIAAGRTQAKKTHGPGALTDRHGGTVLGTALAAGKYVYRTTMVGNFNSVPLGAATVVSGVSLRQIPDGLLNPVRVADPANNDWTIIGDTGSTGAGLERPDIEYLDAPASIAEAEAWVIGRKMPA